MWMQLCSVGHDWIQCEHCTVVYFSQSPSAKSGPVGLHSTTLTSSSSPFPSSSSLELESLELSSEDSRQADIPSETCLKWPCTV